MTRFVVRRILALVLMATVAWSAVFAPLSSYAVTGLVGIPQIWADSPITRGAGTTFHFNYSGAADPDWRIFKWSLSISSQDEWPPEYQYSYSRFNPSNPFEGVGTVSDELIPLTWNGRTNSGVVFPPGTYTVTFVMAVFVNSQIHAVDHSFEISVQSSAPAPTPAPTPTPTPTPIPTPTIDPAAAFDPVVLIHGLGGTPEQWQNASINNDYFSLLKSWGYPDNYIAAYHYAGVGVGKNGYNNQGDIPTMAGNMRQTIMQLRQASLSRGGDGEVDIVAFSMGGLIARQYVKDYPNDHYLDQVISIGTPYQGSWLMESADKLGPVEQPTNYLLMNLFRSAGLGIDPNQLATQQMKPMSNVLQQLSVIPRKPEIEYYTLFGDMNARLSMTLFDVALYSKQLNIGDGVVSAASAKTVSAYQSSTSTRYYDNVVRDISFKLEPASFGFGYNAVMATGSVVLSRYFHLHLTRQSDVQSEARGILLNE